MSNTITEILHSDRQSNQQVDALLQQEGIRRDGNLDYTCGIFDDALSMQQNPIYSVAILRYATKWILMAAI